MFNVEKTDYGMKFTFSGFISEQEMREWARKVGEIARNLPKNYRLLVDMRGMQPLPREAWHVMEKAQQKGMQAGMSRVAVVVDDPITSMQFKRFARQTGMAEIEREIDATVVIDWERVAMDWLIKGIEPRAVDPGETRIMPAFTEPQKP